VHRIGRTGRIGRDGKAFTLVTPEQGRLLTQVEIYIGKQVLVDEIPNFVACRKKEKPAEPAKAASAAAPVPSRYRRAL
jgi:ATP-dependent RNA helicase DeaD